MYIDQHKLNAVQPNNLFSYNLSFQTDSLANIINKIIIQVNSNTEKITHFIDDFEKYKIENNLNHFKRDTELKFDQIYVF